VELDTARRKRLYAELQLLVAEELPYLSLYHADNTAVFGPRLTSVALWPNGSFRPLAAVELRAGELASD
jgi:ABC-type transport system substrate-binding protein